MGIAFSVGVVIGMSREFGLRLILKAPPDVQSDEHAEQHQSRTDHHGKSTWTDLLAGDGRQL